MKRCLCHRNRRARYARNNHQRSQVASSNCRRKQLSFRRSKPIAQFAGPRASHGPFKFFKLLKLLSFKPQRSSSEPELVSSKPYDYKRSLEYHEHAVEMNCALLASRPTERRKPNAVGRVQGGDRCSHTTSSNDLTQILSSVLFAAFHSFVYKTCIYKLLRPLF